MWYLREEQPVGVVRGEFAGDVGRVQRVDSLGGGIFYAETPEALERKCASASPCVYYVRLLGARRCLPLYQEDLEPISEEMLQARAVNGHGKLPRGDVPGGMSASGTVSEG